LTIENPVSTNQVTGERPFILLETGASILR